MSDDPGAESPRHRHRTRRRRDRPAEADVPPARAPEAPVEPREADKVLRGLVGAGPSQLSLDAALRARDASRPSDDDLADAEQNLTIVRRQYVPTESLPP